MYTYRKILYNIHIILFVNPLRISEMTSKIKRQRLRDVIRVIFFVKKTFKLYTAVRIFLKNNFYSYLNAHNERNCIFSWISFMMLSWSSRYYSYKLCFNVWKVLYWSTKGPVTVSKIVKLSGKPAKKTIAKFKRSNR